MGEMACDGGVRGYRISCSLGKGPLNNTVLGVSGQELSCGLINEGRFIYPGYPA